MRSIYTIKCTHVDAQVSLGYYDAEGNLIGEEVFPQSQGGLVTARLFHPHIDQLRSLIETCVEQAWAKLTAQAEPQPPEAEQDGQGAPQPGSAVPAAQSMDQVRSREGGRSRSASA